MCRLFGFRSVIPSQVHRSIVAADNALYSKSELHKDGWGVAFYVDGNPHLTRSALTAMSDHMFHRLSGIVASETVVAHVRRATQGAVSVLNSHPFQYGRWVFAHNGDVRNFQEHRAQLLAQVSAPLRRFIFGDTDSEVLFFLFLSELRNVRPVNQPFSTQEIVDAIDRAFSWVRSVCDRPDAGEESLLTVIVTDGTNLVAAQGGRELYWSTHKTKCPDRDVCPSLAPECEAPTQTGHVNHLLISSETLSGANVWNPMKRDEVVAVDGNMNLLRTQLGRPRTSVAPAAE